MRHGTPVGLFCATHSQAKFLLLCPTQIRPFLPGVERSSAAKAVENMEEAPQGGEICADGQEKKRNTEDDVPAPVAGGRMKKSIEDRIENP